MWRIVDPVDGLYRAVADAIAERAQDILRRQARFTMVLSGGNTPRALYALLANAYRHRIDWNRVHFFWGDERYVPLDHPASNYRMAREVLIDPLETTTGERASHASRRGGASTHCTALRGASARDLWRDASL